MKPIEQYCKEIFGESQWRIVILTHENEKLKIEIEQLKKQLPSKEDKDKKSEASTVDSSFGKRK